MTRRNQALHSSALRSEKCVPTYTERSQVHTGEKGKPFCSWGISRREQVALRGCATCILSASQDLAAGIARAMWSDVLAGAAFSSRLSWGPPGLLSNLSFPKCSFPYVIASITLEDFVSSKTLWVLLTVSEGLNSQGVLLSVCAHVRDCPSPGAAPCTWTC